MLGREREWMLETEGGKSIRSPSAKERKEVVKVGTIETEALIGGGPPWSTTDEPF